MSWEVDALERLESSQSRDGSWGCLAGSADQCVECTALAVLALRAWDLPSKSGENWLLAAQNADGGFRVMGPTGASGWASAVAALAIQAVGATLAAQNACRWVCKRVSTPVACGKVPLGYDVMLPGWTWTAGGMGWVEPTAWALLVLRRGRGEALERCQQAERFLRDRYIDRGAVGGWNHGEPEVVGSRLWPATAPTALALLALSATGFEAGPALRFLEERLLPAHSLLSVAWAAGALLAYGVDAKQVRPALEEAWNWTVAAADVAGPPRHDAVALALLAAAPNGHPLLGTGED